MYLQTTNPDSRDKAIRGEEFFYHILQLDGMQQYINYGYDIDEWPFIVWLDENSPVYFYYDVFTGYIRYKTPEEALDSLWKTLEKD